MRAYEFSELPGLTTQALGRHFLNFEELSSTNDFIKENAHRLPHGTAATAALQTGGKGRLGRRWSERPGAGLALSCLLDGWGAAEMAVLPLVAGLAVCRALEDHCGLSPGIKWSNDVLLGDRKVSGILCESRILGNRGAAVVGIGVNSHHTPADLAHLGLVYATSLFCVTDKKWPVLPLAAAILNHLEPLAEQCRVQGFGPLRGEYRARCLTLGREVRLVKADGTQQVGTALDVDDTGALLVRINGNIRPIAAGEVSVRGLYGYV